MTGGHVPTSWKAELESRGPRQAIVRAIPQACTDLGIDVIAGGVKTVAEYQRFRSGRFALSALSICKGRY